MKRQILRRLRLSRQDLVAATTTQRIGARANADRPLEDLVDRCILGLAVASIVAVIVCSTWVGLP